MIVEQRVVVVDVNFCTIIKESLKGKTTTIFFSTAAYVITTAATTSIATAIETETAATMDDSDEYKLVIGIKGMDPILKPSSMMIGTIEDIDPSSLCWE